jgi:PAS domain S-box-containing protein
MAASRESSHIRVPSGSQRFPQEVDMSSQHLNEIIETPRCPNPGAFPNCDFAMMHLARNVTDYAIYMLDVEGRVLSWNAGAKRLKGYEFEEVFGKHYSMFFPPDAVAAGVPKQELDAARRDGRFEAMGWRQRKGGEKFWALVTLTAIRGPNGQVSGFAKITRDITVQKMLEDEQKRSSLELESRIRERTWQLEAIADELRAEKEKVQSLLVTVGRKLEEKEVLLREVYHRVKNNMQVVQSLLKMGSRAIISGNGRGVIAAAVQRIDVMVTAHERLYQSPELAGLTLPSFLRGIVEGAIAAYTDRANRVQLQMDVDEIPISIDNAILLGLLVNELVSNCLKHGFSKGRGGKIFVSARMIPGTVRIVVHDDGKGLPANFDASRSESMGLKLVQSVARQLGGRVEFLSHDGCRVESDLARLLPQLWQHPLTVPARAVGSVH